MQRNAHPLTSQVFKITTIGGLILAPLALVALPRVDAYEGGVAGFQFRGLERSESNWIKTLDRWLKDHQKATGQTFVYILQTPGESRDQALHELASLPLTLADRKDACVFINSMTPEASGEIQSESVNQECGLGLNALMEFEKLQTARDGLNDIRLDSRAWEARTAWVVLELLRAADSPILTRELRGESATPADLIRYINRWNEASMQAEADDAPMSFDPEGILEEENLSPNAPRSTLSKVLLRKAPDFAFLAVILVLLLGAGRIGRIARSPAFRATSSGLFRIRMTERIRDRAICFVRKALRRPTQPTRFTTLSEDIHVRF